MAEIIDLDFYRKFRIILPVRPDSIDNTPSHEEESYPSSHQRKPFRRKRKGEGDAESKSTNSKPQSKSE